MGAYLGIDIGTSGTKTLLINDAGKILAEASEDKDELVTAQMDMEKVREVRDLWQFFRDRRPEMYGLLTQI